MSETTTNIQNMVPFNVSGMTDELRRELHEARQAALEEAFLQGYREQLAKSPEAVDARAAGAAYARAEIEHTPRARGAFHRVRRPRQ